MHKPQAPGHPRAFGWDQSTPPVGLLATPCVKTITPRLWICNFILRDFEDVDSGTCRIFSARRSNWKVLLFNLKTFANIDWNDDTPTSTCVHVKSVIRDGDVEIYSQLSLKNTQKLDMLYTSLLKHICIIFTNQNTHNIFYYKTLGNVTFEMWSERPHLYLGPTWNTSGCHMNNQPMTPTSPPGLSASHPGGTSIACSLPTRDPGCSLPALPRASPFSPAALSFSFQR